MLLFNKIIDMNVIKEFFPSFQPYIKQLLLGDIGIGAGTIQILEVRSGVRLPPKASTSTPSGDRFKVLIPYAGHFIKWDVLFNAKNPQFPPDFAFSDDFLSDPEEEIIAEEVPSFFNWDYRNDQALLQVIREFLLLYKKYQVDLLSEFHRPSVEYSTLFAADSLNESSVEVLIGSGDTAKKTRSPIGGGGVNFLIALDINFSGLPPGVDTTIKYGRDRALLHVTFHGSDNSRIIPELFISPNLETVLGKTYSIYLPPFPANNCLMDYVPQVIKILQERVNAITTLYEKRKEYISALLLSIPGLIEYDSVTFFTASFLLDHQDFHCLLRITLNEKFPSEKPSFIFQSVYHFVNGRPFEKAGNDFPYSPRWPPTDMVMRARNYSLTFVEQFQKESVEALQNEKENKN